MAIETTSREPADQDWSFPVVRTVAQVDLGPRQAPADGAGSSEGGGPVAEARRSAVFSTALVNIERTVRSDDRVCPFGVSHIAVAFGPDADAVTPQTLGERLARAVGQGHTDGHSERSSSGRARPDHAPATPSVAIPSTTVVTVDRILDDRAAGVPAPATDGAQATPPLLRHRTLVRYSTARLNGYGTRHDDRLPASGRNGLLGTVLVVDPDPRSTTNPGLTAQAASALAGRLGFKSGVLAPGTGEKLPADIDGFPLDLVVLVVGSEPTGGRSSWDTSTWCVPARLTEVYRSMGVEVLAVSSGATAAAMVGCIEQGATVLFDLNALSGALVSRSRSDEPGRPWTSPGRPPELPAPLRSLLRLTSSERRVLFYLTSGLAAQEIAEDLVVSLATVRSHIRSILRKLDVRSQLAAVAVANSCGTPHETSHAS